MFLLVALLLASALLTAAPPASAAAGNGPRRQPRDPPFLRGGFAAAAKSQAARRISAAGQSLCSGGGPSGCSDGGSTTAAFVSGGGDWQRQRQRQRRHHHISGCYYRHRGPRSGRMIPSPPPVMPMPLIEEVAQDDDEEEVEQRLRRRCHHCDSNGEEEESAGRRRGPQRRRRRRNGRTRRWTTIPPLFSSSPVPKTKPSAADAATSEIPWSGYRSWRRRLRNITSWVAAGAAARRRWALPLRLLPSLASTLVLTLLVSFPLYPKRAPAETTSLSAAAVAETVAMTRNAKSATLRRFLLSSLPLRRRRRTLLVVLGLAAWLAWTVGQAALLARRQSADATSEWGRYAERPAARGRAVANLIFLKLLPLLALSKVLPSANARSRMVVKSGDVFADGLLKLGPLYIKLGQIASCRENLLPEEWKSSMERLQDRVPARTGDAALELAGKAWPGGYENFVETFRDFDSTPLAAASLGQVHRATLAANGDAVAIKLQRPFLKEIYDQDLALLTKIAAAVDKFTGGGGGGGGASGKGRGGVGGVSQSWVEIFEDAEEILYREIDYRDEAVHGMRFCGDFGLGKGGKPAEASAKSRDGKPLPSAAPWLRAPHVYDDLSTEKVLVMEYVPCIKITDAVRLDGANVTLEQREYLADMLGRSYLRQFCCNLFFSTDPHPGNLGVEIKNPNATSPESRVRLVFYDFGQVAYLSEAQADGILSIIEAIVDSDVDRSIEAFQQMGVLKEGADLDKVRAKVADNYRTGKVKANRKRLKKRGYKFKPKEQQGSASSSSSSGSNATATTGANATTANATTSDSEVMQYFTLPAEYAFVGRALSQMDGVGKSLDAEFDFVSSAAPWIVEIKGAGEYLRDEAAKWWKKNVVDPLEGIFPKSGTSKRR